MGKLRIDSDRFNQFQQNSGGFADAIPVDLYGKRVYPNKNDPANLANAAQDIQDFYDLQGTAGLKDEGSSTATQSKEQRKVQAK